MLCCLPMSFLIPTPCAMTSSPTTDLQGKIKSNCSNKNQWEGPKIDQVPLLMKWPHLCINVATLHYRPITGISYEVNIVRLFSKSNYIKNKTHTSTIEICFSLFYLVLSSLFYLVQKPIITEHQEYKYGGWFHRQAAISSILNRIPCYYDLHTA